MSFGLLCAELASAREPELREDVGVVSIDEGGFGSCRVLADSIVVMKACFVNGILGKD